METKKVHNLVDKGAELLKNVSETPRLDSEMLLAHILKWERFQLILNHEKIVTAEQERQFNSLIGKRCEKLPVAYILKKKYFFEDIFYVDERVLVPRPETEILVESAANYLKNNKHSSSDILDICCGSGCIGLSIFKFFDGSLTLSDISDRALEVTEINRKSLFPGRNDIKTIKSDIFDNIEGKFDIITANPPYLSEKDMEEIKSTAVEHEPALALYGGKSGFELPEKIIKDAHNYLKQEGFLFMELGFEGAAFVIELKSGLKLIEIKKDYSGIDRVAIWQKV